jgi:predicted GNAT family acetyltransferase
MNIVEIDGIEAFWRETEAFLSRDPANNTHQLSATKRIRTVGANHGEQYFIVRDDIDIVGSAVIVDTRTVFLSTMPITASQLLAAHFLAKNVALAGALGRQDLLHAFNETYAKPHTVHVNLMLYELKSEANFGRASGRVRLAEISDLDLLIQWMDAFEKEVHSIAMPTPLRERVVRRINDQQLVLWIDDTVAPNAVVAFAGFNRLPALSARIGPVYTPPELRARGYAQAVTAAASVEAVRDAPCTVFLFTDAVYPASNKAYQRIGYVHIANHAHCLYAYTNG